MSAAQIKRSAEAYHPIWLKPEDTAKPFNQLVQEARDELVRIRGRIYDIQRLYPGWSERVSCAEGGLTCVISALYPGMMEYQLLHEKKQEEQKTP